MPLPACGSSSGLDAMLNHVVMSVGDDAEPGFCAETEIDTGAEPYAAVRGADALTGADSEAARGRVRVLATKRRTS